MRLLCALLACLALASGSNQHVERVLQTWSSEREIKVMDLQQDIFEEEDFVEDHSRSKRAAGGIPFTSQCSTPGYTGAACNIPICYETNYQIPDIPATQQEGAPIEAASLPNCTTPYTILLDDSLYSITISLRSEKYVNPRFNLLAPDGTYPSPDSTPKNDGNTYQNYYGQLAAGQYVVIPIADVSDGACNLQVNAPTELTVVGGFTYVEKANYDPKRSDFPKANSLAGVNTNIIMHTNRARSPAIIETVTVVGEENTYNTPMPVTIRYSCGYEYTVDRIVLPTKGDYFFQVEGITFNGFRYRRIVPFTVFAQPATSPTPSPAPTAPPSKCQNNGVLVNPIDGSNPYCFCQGLWQGNDCSQRICMNGGKIRADNTCDCGLAAFDGDHCQNVICSDPETIGFDSESPSLILVVRTRQSMNDIVAQVQQAVDDFVFTMANVPKAIHSYILVTFNNDNMLEIRRYGSEQYNDLKNQLISASQSVSVDGGCSDIVLSSIAAALSNYPNNKSPAYIITDATPDDSALFNDVIVQLSYNRVPLNFIYVPPPPATCTVTPADPNYRTMQDLARKSSGMLFYMSNRTNVHDILLSHLTNTYYHAQLLLANDLEVCSNQDPYKSVAIEGTADQITVVATGNNLSPLLISPEGDAKSYSSVYQDGQNYIWTFPGPHTGNWFVSVLSLNTGTVACNFKIYQKAFNSLSSAQMFDMFLGFTTDMEIDAPLVQPIAGLPSAPAVHINNYPFNQMMQNVHAAMTVTVHRNGKQVELYASNGIWRDGCGYNFYFHEFTCSVPDETLYFTFFARDADGMAIQRSAVMVCLAFDPPPPYQGGDCRNYGVPGPDNSTCFCPPGWTGKKCEYLLCYNGGTPQSNNQKCNCPVGWDGQFCDIPVCLTRGPDPEFLINYVDMVFAVELTAQGWSQIHYLNLNFADLIRDVQHQNPNWIANFVLVGYNSTWGDVLAVAHSENPAPIIQEMNKLAQAPPTDTGCVVQLYKALDKALQKRTISAGSYVHIFQTSPADKGEMEYWNQLYENSRANKLIFNDFLAVSNKFPGGFFCNATADDFQMMFNLVGSSTGTVYDTQQATVADIIKIIPLQYQNGYVYSGFKEDCTDPKNPETVYFPIDAYAQTIQLNVFGSNQEIHVFDSNGVENVATLLASDTLTDLSVYEVRQPCDGLWQSTGQYCILTAPYSLTWFAAENYCQSAGGFLADDLTKDKHDAITSAVGDVLQPWIGLFNNGSGYLWTRGASVSALPLTQTNQYWYPNGTQPPYNPNKDCVFWKADASGNGYTWNLGDCSGIRPFICQKHRYDQHYVPTNFDDDDLPAGKWWVTVKTGSNSTLTPCGVQVRVQSSLQVMSGFTTSMTNDWPAFDPVALTQTNQYWYPNGTQPPYNPNKDCVFWKADASGNGYTWNLGDCSGIRPFICQKHRYDQHYVPTNFDDDDLPAGKWWVTVKTGSNSTLTPCGVQVRVQSSLQVMSGFTTSMTNDWPAFDPVADSPNNRIATFIHSEDNENRTPILTHALLFDSYNGTFYNGLQYGYRFGCETPWISDYFSCPNGDNQNNDFVVAHMGEDEFGNAFQRISTGHCSPPVLTCGNGGYRYNGSCYCDEYWTGEWCTIPICVNNGTRDSTEYRCICQSGFTGPNCQYAQCEPMVRYHFGGQKTLVIVLEATKQNMDAMNQLATNFNSIIANATASQPNWFQNFGLVMFDTTGVSFQSFDYTSALPVQMAIQSQISRITDPGACTSKVYLALNTALSYQSKIVFPDSQVLLISSSSASDVPDSMETAERLAYSEAQLHWIFQSSAACGDESTAASAPGLINMAYASTGNVAMLKSTELTNNFTCENGSWFIQVDTNTTQMFVSITSAYGSLGVHDPAGNPVAADVLYNNGNQKLYSVDTTRMPGFYTVSAGSIGACYISVYSVGGAVVYGYFAQPSSVDPLGTHMDGLTKTPAAGALNVATFHLESVPGHRGQLLYAVIFDATSKQMILRSELYLRAGCSWEYFSDPFTCNTDLLTIYVHGMDETNQEFRRHIMAYCLNGTLSTRQPATVGTTTLPPVTVPLTTATTAANIATGTPVITVAPPITTTQTTKTVNTATPPVTTAGTTKTAAPPKTTATPSGPVTTSSTYGNTQLDVVFLIDGSKPATNLYIDMTQFVTSLMSSFTVGQDYARVGLIPVFGSPGGDGISQAGFSTISSQNQLVQYLSQMQGGWGDFVSSGEFTNTAILTAMDPSYVSATSGYRASISNHLMVYITANTAFSDNPSTVKALQSNTYGVITIGYGPGATDAATLQTLAGGAACTFTAANSATLQGLVPQVQSLIFNARLNGGKYCGNGN